MRLSCFKSQKPSCVVKRSSRTDLIKSSQRTNVFNRNVFHSVKLNHHSPISKKITHNNVVLAVIFDID